MVIVGPTCFAGAVTELRTGRLHLHPIDLDEGERIAARQPAPTDAWADDYPFEGDVRAVGAFLRAWAADGDQRPFGYYRISRLADGSAIGGIGFKGRPDHGSVEVGYGLVPSARRHGFAAEALVALLGVAADAGVTRVTAETTVDNPASRRTLERAGFRLVGTDGELQRFDTVVGDEQRSL